ncbi:hypothetical protein [Gottfriedia luciferensis]|uniref:hypothetical protein n=1 Tax=Gottfriedia luciferensis TaxID=178774 RepID=UPI000B43F094|nr:hypothetical protein [Gottfriedia luciferensis]
MKKYVDIQYVIDAFNKVEFVEVKKYKIEGDTHSISESICLKEQGVYTLKNKNEKEKRLRERSVVLQSFILDDLGNPSEAMVFFRDDNSFGKVNVFELSLAFKQQT